MNLRRSTSFSIVGFLEQANNRLDQALVKQVMESKGVDEHRAEQIVAQKTRRSLVQAGVIR